MTASAADQNSNASYDASFSEMMKDLRLKLGTFCIHECLPTVCELIIQVRFEFCSGRTVLLRRGENAGVKIYD